MQPGATSLNSNMIRDGHPYELNIGAQNKLGTWPMISRII
jgi:hypothetical protein